jgi:hypothetical protein
LYSFPYLIRRSQKCGICHKNIKAEKNRILSFKTVPPAEVYPIRGGIDPTNAPGIMARSVIFFREV